MFTILEPNQLLTKIVEKFINVQTLAPELKPVDALVEFARTRGYHRIHLFIGEEIANLCLIKPDNLTHKLIFHPPISEDFFRLYLIHFGGKLIDEAPIQLSHVYDPLLS